MERFFAHTAVVVLLLNCILYFRSFSYYGKAFKIFTLYLASILLLEITLRILGHFRCNNIFLSHLYFVFQFVFLSLFYYNILKNNTQKNIIKMYAGCYVLAIIVLYSMVITNFYSFNQFEIFISSFPIVIYAIFYLYNMLNEKKEFYYINTGVMIYISASTIIFLSGNIINLFDPKLASKCWTFNSILYFFYQVLIFIELKKNYSKLHRP